MYMLLLYEYVEQVQVLSRAIEAIEATSRSKFKFTCTCTVVCHSLSPPLGLWNRFILTRTPPKVYLFGQDLLEIYGKMYPCIYRCIYLYTRIDLSRPELVQKSYFYRQLKSQGGGQTMAHHGIACMRYLDLRVIR